MKTLKAIAIIVILLVLLPETAKAQKIIPNDRYGTGLFILKSNNAPSQQGSFCDQPEYIGNYYWNNTGTNQRGIAFWTGGSDCDLNSSVVRMLIRRDGKVGIGTNNPTRLLDLNGAFRVRSGGVNGDPLIDLDHSDTTGWSRINSEGKLALAANDKLTGSSSLPHLFIDTDGSIFVTGGANLPSVSSQSRSKYSLFVQKGLLSEDYGLAPQATWADYVFSKNYKLMPLEQLSTYIQKYKHLPNMPTANEISKDGYSLHKMNVRLTEKIEELTLYTLKQQEELDKVRKDFEALLKLVKPILQQKVTLKNQKNDN